MCSTERTHLDGPDAGSIGVGALIALILVDQGSAIAVKILWTSADGSTSNERTAHRNIGEDEDGESSRDTGKHCNFEIAAACREPKKVGMVLFKRLSRFIYLLHLG